MYKLLKKMKSQKGLTLIELLGVVAIIAVLAGIAIPAILRSVNDAKVGSTIQTAATMRSALLRAQAASITATTQGTFPAAATAIADSAGFDTLLGAYWTPVTPPNYTFVSYQTSDNGREFLLCIRALDGATADVGTLIVTTEATSPVAADSCAR